MDDAENAIAVDFKDVVAEIETHEASHLVMFDRNAASGYVTFKFYGTNGELMGKLTFDEVSEDMVPRAKAVLDFLSSTPRSMNSIPYQEAVQSAWDGAEIATVGDGPGASI
jgi:hypothetical protein